MPTLTVLGGIHTTAAGPEDAPTYATKVVSMTGTVAATLTNAETRHRRMDAQPPTSRTSLPKNAYTAAQVDVCSQPRAHHAKSRFTATATC